MNTDTSSPFRFSVDLAVVEHLGEQLYSNVGAVLTEAVANAWDADATQVKIQLLRNGADEVTGILIHDDGVGMSRTDINERYLRIAYRKRMEEGDTTEGGRPIMGRKGIGKLSLLAIAGRIRVETKKEGEDLQALEIVLTDLKRAISERGEDGEPEYRPPVVEPRHADRIGEHGTVIELSELRRDRLRNVSPEGLRRRLARRFSVIGRKDFRVYVDGTEVTPADRDDLKFAQFLWVFEGTELDYETQCENLKEKPQSVPCKAEDWPDDWQVRGWLATVDKPRSLSTREGNLNSVVVMARGRLVMEDILPRITGAQLFTKYVTGQIEADFLDDSKQEDIVTSDRQRVLEDDERVDGLVRHLVNVMRKIEEEWSGLRQKSKQNELFARFPGLENWLNELQDEPRRKATRLLNRIYSEYSDEEDETALREIMRAALYGFERLRLREIDPDRLHEALDEGVDSLLRLLSDRDDLEASLYRDIVRNRLDAIKNLARLTRNDEKEKVLQRYLFDHLWLLDPAWDRATENAAMEEGIRSEEPFGNDETTRAQYGRIDIRFRTVGGETVIVELKRYGVRPEATDLYDQVKKYVHIMQRKYPSESFQVVVVVGDVGKAVVDEATKLIGTLGVPGRVVTYDELIVGATRQYDEFLERSRVLDKLERILEHDAEES